MDRTTPMAPKKKADALDKRFNMLVNSNWLARVEEHAARLGLNASAFIRMAVTERMDASTPTPPPRRPRQG